METKQHKVDSNNMKTTKTIHKNVQYSVSMMSEFKLD